MENKQESKEMVILVDEQDCEIGAAPKLEAHCCGWLHRAFSVFLFDRQKKLLVQRRAKNKYHSGGLWANSCCSHPRPGEETFAAAHRRLREELGVDCEFKELFTFIYKAELDKGLFEHEYDHILIGCFDVPLMLDCEEVMAWQWLSLDQLKDEIKNKPEQYASWLRLSLEEVINRQQEIF